MKQKRITWVEISTHALRYNISQFKKILSPTVHIMAVVKSNAYGHGMYKTAQIVSLNKNIWIGTVNLDEALELRKNGIHSKILVLSFFDPMQLEKAIKQNITLTIYGLQAAKKINRAASKLGKKAVIHFKVDTGTSRLGLLPDKSVETIQKIQLLKNIKLEGIFTHFADAENQNQKVTNNQIAVFKEVIEMLDDLGIEIPIKHCACSAATILNTASHFDLVRIGISLYGLYSIEPNGTKSRRIKKRLGLKPALAWRTKIIQIKTIPAGSSVGYGRTFKTKRAMKIALIPVGYWDGLDRRNSNNGIVIIKGQRCSIRGRICMNLTMIDVTHLKTVCTGDIVTLIGKDGKSEITVDEIAQNTKTINYEVITRINPLIPRIFNK